MKHLSLSLAGSMIAFTSLATTPRIHAQAPTPVVPGDTNFNFIRGIVETFDASEGLAMIDHNGDSHILAVPETASLVNQAGEPVESSVLQRGANVTVTVIDPQQADATSIVRRIVVANPLAGDQHEMVEGLVLRMLEGQNAVTFKPSKPGTENISFTYNEGDTEFVGNDGTDVREEELEAGDRIMVYLAAQEDGGVMAQRIIFLGDSGEPSGNLEAIDGDGVLD